MKKFFTLLAVLYAGQAWAQDTLNTKEFIREFDQIRKQEMAAHQRMFGPDGQTGTSGFTIASNNFDVHHINMDWYLDPSIHYISGNIGFNFTITQSTNTITFDLLNKLVVDSVRYHGANINFQRTTDDGVIVNFPSTINASTKDSVTIYYQGVPGASGFGTFFQGKHNSGSNGPAIWTLSEPYGAREWWPCKNNLVDKADSIDVYVTNPQQYQASSNGLIVSNVVNGANRTTHFKHRFPIATYLVAVAVTDYQTTTDTAVVGSTIIPIQNFFYAGGASGFNAYISYHRNAMRTFSRWFGLYPFAAEKYGHTQWDWGGGMEHQTNSFISGPTPNLAAHELAHQWFGDYVTCGSWADIWLNEGFATYLTLLFLEDKYPNSYWPYLGSMYSSAIADSSGSVYVDDTTNVSRVFSAKLTYNKGGYVLRMLRQVVGDSAFARGVRAYISDPKVRLGFARTDDLKKHMEAESGKDLSKFFQKWIYGQGYPNYKAEWTQNANKWVTVKLSQSTTHPSVSFYEMPVTLLLKGGTQEVSYDVQHMYSGQEFSFNPGFAIDTVMIDPDYWILARYRTSVKKAASTISNELKIYPNPAPDHLFISLGNPTDKKLYLRLYNTLGQLIWQKDMDTPGNNELIDIPVATLAKGVYYLQVRSEKNIKLLRKIVH